MIPELCGLVLLDCWAHFAPRPLLWRPWAPQAPARKKKARRKAQKHWDMLFLVRKTCPNTGYHARANCHQHPWSSGYDVSLTR